MSGAPNVSGSQQPDPIVTACMAEKARLEAQKEVLDARKALADAQRSAGLSAAQAAIGTVARSGIEGTVKVDPDAGKGEATLLASHAIVTAAEKIAKKVEEKAGNTTIVIQSYTDAPQFANYRQFLLQQALLLREFDTAQNEATRLEAQADGLQQSPPAAQPEALPAAAVAIPPITKVGVLIDAL